MTAADFVRGRFGIGTLALAIAVTGIVATMPYIALQLVGMEVVLRLGSSGAIQRAIGRLLIAFAICRRLHLYERPARARHDRGGEGYSAST